jgi:hypothetical protein
LSSLKNVLSSWFYFYHFSGSLWRVTRTRMKRNFEGAFSCIFRFFFFFCCCDVNSFCYSTGKSLRSREFSPAIIRLFLFYSCFCLCFWRS